MGLCGFDSQGTHVLTKICIACKLLWIKASAKCINVSEGRWLITVIQFGERIVTLTNVYGFNKSNLNT